MNSVLLPYSTEPIIDKGRSLPKFCRESRLSCPLLGERSSLFLKGLAGNSYTSYIFLSQYNNPQSILITMPCMKKLYAFLLPWLGLLSLSFISPQAPRNETAWVFIRSPALVWAPPSLWELEKALEWEEGTWRELCQHNRALQALMTQPHQKQPTASLLLLCFLIPLHLQARKILIHSCPQITTNS